MGEEGGEERIEKAKGKNTSLLATGSHSNVVNDKIIQN